MTRSDIGSAVIQQAFFGFDDRRGGDGHTMLASSLPNDGQEAASWRNRLRECTRLLPYFGQPPPAASLMYLRFGDDGVVLRRVDAGYSEGRTNAHALIGPASVLTPQRALELEHWDRWLSELPSDPASSLSSISPHDLTAHPDVRARLEDGARHQHNQIAVVLGWLLDISADSPLAVIAAPDADLAALQWGLVAAGQALLTSRQWTFSTYELKLATRTDLAPDISFFPGDPENRRSAQKTPVVDLSKDHPWPSRRSFERANRSVGQYVLGPAGRALPGASGEYDSAPQSVAPESPPDIPEEVRSGEFAPQLPANIARAVSFEVGDVAETGPALSHGVPQKSESRFPTPPESWAGELVSELVSSPDMCSLGESMGRIERNIRDSPGSARELQSALQDVRFAVQTVERVLEDPGQQADMFRRIIAAALGPYLDGVDDEAGREAVGELLRRSSNATLIEVIVSMAAGTGRTGELAHYVGLRWLDERAQLASSSHAWTALRRLSLAGSPPGGRRLSLLVAAALVIVVCVTVGMLLGLILLSPATPAIPPIAEPQPARSPMRPPRPGNATHRPGHPIQTEPGRTTWVIPRRQPPPHREFRSTPFSLGTGTIAVRCWRLGRRWASGAGCGGVCRRGVRRRG
jgi:hypothetical protein